jgi:transposase
MARRRILVADVKEILVHWDAGDSISGIAHSLGYSRPTVRKYVQAAERVGLVRGSRPVDELGWERAARAAIADVGAVRRIGDATLAVAAFHEYLEQRVGSVRLSVLHQRLRDDDKLKVSWPTFYRYARQHWPERLRPSPRITVRLDDPPPGEEAQIDYFYVGLWQDPETQRRHRLSALLITLSHSRHEFLYPVISEDATSWLEGHVAAFTFFGGAPRRLVPDNLGSTITRGDRYDPRVNRAYAELLRYYGCIVDPSRLARPTDKPRVERAGGYSRASFFAGRTFASLPVMRQEAGALVHRRRRPAYPWHHRRASARRLPGT